MESKRKCGLPKWFFSRSPTSVHCWQPKCQSDLGTCPTSANCAIHGTFKRLPQPVGSAGVQLHENVTVKSLEPDSSGGIVAIAPEHEYHASQACICSGAWSRLLLDHMDIHTGIMPIRGQMVLYNTQQALLRHVVNEGHRYLVARDDGRLLAGSCEEEVGFDVATTASMIEQLRNWAESILPELKSATHRTNMGRPASRYFRWLSLHWASSQFEASVCGQWTLSRWLASIVRHAVVIADLMQARQPTIDLSPFRVGRG